MALRFSKRDIGLGIKVVVALLAVGFIMRELRVRNTATDLFNDLLMLLDGTHAVAVTLLLVAMLANWTLEAYKWRVLVGSIEKISIFRSLMAVFSGVTIAFFTPNRVGEYGGRVFHLDKADRIDAVILTVVGSYAQLTVTIVAGLMALTFYLPAYEGTGPLSYFQYGFMAIGMLVLCCFLVILFLNHRLLVVVLSKLRIPRSVMRYVQVLEVHSPASLVRVLMGSAGRYAIFTAQFFMLLRVFSVDVDYTDAMVMIAMTYLVMTGIPTIAITEVVTRGSVAVFFLSQLSDNVSGIVSASSVLWLVNLVIPALFGVVTIFGLRFFRQ